MTVKFKKIISSFAFLLYSTSGFSYDPSALENFSGTVNEFIWTGRAVPASLIQDRLGFLADDDKKIIEQHISPKLNKFKEELGKTTIYDHESDKNLLGFLDKCQEIYQLYEDFYKVPQAAVQILFERVYEKYIEHANTLKKNKELLKELKKQVDPSSRKRKPKKDSHSPHCKNHKAEGKENPSNSALAH